MYYDILLSKLSDLTIITTSIYEIVIFCIVMRKKELPRWRRLGICGSIGYVDRDYEKDGFFSQQ